MRMVASVGGVVAWVLYFGAIAALFIVTCLAGTPWRWRVGVVGVLVSWIGAIVALSLLDIPEWAVISIGTAFYLMAEVLVRRRAKRQARAS